jgi:hypothetical protein
LILFKQIKSGAKEVAIFGAASESFSRLATRNYLLTQLHVTFFIERISTAQLKRVWSGSGKCVLQPRKGVFLSEGIALDIECPGWEEEGEGEGPGRGQ